VPDRIEHEIVECDRHDLSGTRREINNFPQLLALAA
jgi:hypothetical protein